MTEKPVAERLQVKGERRLAVVGASAVVDDQIGVKKQRCDTSEADVILLFAADRRRLDSTLPTVLEKAPKDAIIWIAYPKLTSKLAGDLSRNLIHAVAAKSGLDTVSQIAIDDDWSAMRVGASDSEQNVLLASAGAAEGTHEQSVFCCSGSAVERPVLEWPPKISRNDRHHPAPSASGGSDS